MKIQSEASHEGLVVPAKELRLSLVGCNVRELKLRVT